MANKLLYFLVVKPLSMLPFWFLYGVSDVLKFLVYRVFGYRKKVVLSNLRNSFPEKTDDEINRIASQFYSHFTDLVIESLKMFSISEKELLKRMKSLNSEVLHEIYNRGKDVILVSGHFGSWEMWATAGAKHMLHNPRGVYMPLKNKFWNEKMKQSRGSYGMNLVSVHDAKNQLGKFSEPCALILLIDQSPSKKKKCYWTEFLNQETAINFGMESLASKHDVPVVYGDIQKVTRGHYEVTWTVLEESIKDLPYGYITEKATHKIEEKVRAYPQYWLWTHKRWKRKRTDQETLGNVYKP